MKSAAKLTKRVTDIIDKHPALGLQGWELHISIVDEVTGAARKSVAGCSCSTHYDSMWLEFEREWLNTASHDEIDKTIFHELLHAVFRDLDFVAHDGVSEYLGEPHLSTFQEAYMHEVEGIIEKVARTLNYYYRESVVQSS